MRAWIVHRLRLAICPDCAMPIRLLLIPAFMFATYPAIARDLVASEVARFKSLNVVAEDFIRIAPLPCSVDAKAAFYAFDPQPRTVGLPQDAGISGGNPRGTRGCSVDLNARKVPSPDLLLKGPSVCSPQDQAVPVTASARRSAETRERRLCRLRGHLTETLG
jgi:hypothetical protein